MLRTDICQSMNVLDKPDQVVGRQPDEEGVLGMRIEDEVRVQRDPLQHALCVSDQVERVARIGQSPHLVRGADRATLVPCGMEQRSLSCS